VEWGSIEKQAQCNQFFQATGFMPEGADPPEIYPWLRPIWDVFQTLSSSRVWNDGIPYSLTFTEIKDYLEYIGYDKQDILDMFQLIRIIDSEYASLMIEKLKESRKHG